MNHELNGPPCLRRCSVLYHMLRRGPRYRAVLVQPSGLDMAAVTKLVEEGKLHPVVDRTFPLDNVREAHEYSEQGHVRGKIVLET